MKKIILLSSLIAVFSCNSNKENDTTKTKVQAVTLDQIKAEEKKIDIQKPNKDQVIALTSLMQRYVDSLPKDKKSPILLVKISDYYHALNMLPQKARIYKRIIDNYPDFKDVDMITYLYALELDREFNLRDDAKKFYQLYIEKYPDSDYINDAKSRLKTIDSLTFKELEELIVSGKLNLTE